MDGGRERWLLIMKRISWRNERNWKTMNFNFLKWQNDPCLGKREIHSFHLNLLRRTVFPVIVKPSKSQPNCQLLFLISGDKRLPLNHRQKIFPNGTLIITDPDRRYDEGKYTCFVTGSYDPKDNKVASSSTFLSILGKNSLQRYSCSNHSLHPSQCF